MGLSDLIQGWLNPNIITRYKDIHTHHSEALKVWVKQNHHIISASYSSRPKFSDKQRIVDHEEQILKIEKDLQREKEEAERKAVEEKVRFKKHYEVIGTFFSCPHATYEVAKKLSLSNLPDFQETYPKFEKSDPSVSPSTKTPYTILMSYAISTLSQEDGEKLHPLIDYIKNREPSILDEMENEWIYEKYRTEIVAKPKRKQYYIDYLLNNSKSAADVHYLVTHIEELDEYIKAKRKSEYLALRKQYPLGVRYCTDNYKGYSQTKVDTVLEHKDQIKGWNDICLKYEELKKKYPLGLPSFEKYSSYDDGKNSASLDISEIIQSEDSIAEFENKGRIANFYSDWLKTQKDFGKKCRDLVPECLNGWGAYMYNIPFKIKTSYGEEKEVQYPVWQFFYDAHSFYENPEFKRLFPYRVRGHSYITGLMVHTIRYNNSVYDRILTFIDKLEILYPNAIEVILAKSQQVVDGPVEYQFSYLIEKLKERKTRYSLYTAEPWSVEEQTHYVVVELFTDNEHLKKICDRLLNIKQECFAECQKPIRHTCFSDIVYISILKEYDTEESISLMNKEIERLKLEEEKKRQEEERRKQEELLRQQEEQRKKELIHTLKSKISEWYTPRLSEVKYFPLFYYYPLTCEFEANEDEWNIRNIIWDFKSSPHREMTEDEITRRRIKSHNRVYHKIRFVLKHYFEEDLLKQLTLVCIPTSTKENTVRRFKGIAGLICQETGMTNGYDHIEITKDGVSKRDPSNDTGKSIPAEVKVDSNFFQDKNVLLFDDVITTGSTLERFKNIMEESGAHVIGALSLGKTKHERQGKNPIEILTENGTLQDDTIEDLPF